MPSQYLQTISTLYPIQKNFNLRLFHYLSILSHGLRRLSCGLRRLCVLGCAGYVVWVAQAMWSRLRRLCAGLFENKAKLSPAKLGLRLSLAIKEGSKCLSNIYKLSQLYTQHTKISFWGYFTTCPYFFIGCIYAIYWVAFPWMPKFWYL